MSEQSVFQVDLSHIEERKKTLEQIKVELKAEFVGIDYIIDELIDYIQIWYLMPEILTRPIIINLWGMTGVGKTDLVRKLVQKLNFQDRFAEVELSNSDSSSYYSWRSSVGAILEANSINDGAPAIVLFDEIQRFNTLDSDGEALVNTRFQDFWELLSDGRLAKREVKEDIEHYMNSFLFSSLQNKKRKKENIPPPVDASVPPPEEDSPEGIGLWQAAQLKKLFELEETVFNLAEMSEENLLAKMQERKSQKKIYEAIDHSKTLILVSGNLDDAFSMARETSEADVDADIFHAYTQKITLVDVKDALSKRFKPEQVARFGNIHLIYRSLQKKDFETLIQKEIERVQIRHQAFFGLKLQVTDAIRTLIYQNGVFPVQGVRPIFSSIIDILESNLAKFTYEALIRGQHEVQIDYDFGAKEILAHFENEEVIRLPYQGRIDKIRQSNQDDMVANVSVHEAGHAVVYAALFGLAPLQLKSTVASSYAAGFTFPHQIYLTKQSILDKIKVLLAGGLAEEIVFGENLATIGRHHDRAEATKLAIDYIRHYGFSKDFQAYYSEMPNYAMNQKVTDAAIEDMIQEMVQQAQMLLVTHKAFLLDLSIKLNQKGNLSSEEVRQIAERHEIIISVKDEAHTHLDPYSSHLKEAQA